jgi:opacity protein-like surface antigen
MTRKQTSPFKHYHSKSWINILPALFLSACISSKIEGHATLTGGFFINFNAGHGTISTKFSNSGNSGNLQSASHNGNLGIGVGYGQFYGCHYLGGEFSFVADNVKIINYLSPAFGQGKQTLKRFGNLGLSARYGFLCSRDTMLYGRLGAHLTKWHLKDDFYTFIRVLNTSINLLSISPGIGIETAVHQNTIARVEYSYEFNSNVTARQAGNSVIAGTLRSQAAKVGLSYKF